MSAAAAAAAPTRPAAQQALLEATAAFVAQELQGNDGSHDFSHIQRVRATALHLGRLEGLDEASLLLVELAALLHDIGDWKYAASGTDQGAEAITAFLSSQGQPPELIQRVTDIVAVIGFKEELAGGGQARQLSREAAVVQDADRLDAIGAVGIARCLTFGGRFNRVLHDPAVPPRDKLSKAAYMSGGARSTTINHFYEKLLKITDLMKTDAGRQLAQQRHAFMEAFLQQFHAEWAGEA